MRIKKFYALVPIVFLFLSSCAINMTHSSESILKVWRDSPESANSMRSELISNGFEIEKSSDRFQVLFNERGCRINLFFDDEKRLTSFERVSGRQPCLYSVKVSLAPQ